VRLVRDIDRINVDAGYLGRDDQRRNLVEAKRSDVGG
jgi:hypothetical protein